MEISIINDGNFTSGRLISLAVNCYLLQTYEKKILIDTGIGDGVFYDHNKYSVEKPRQLLKILRDMDVVPYQIDYVINTHLHFDHSNGNFDAEGNCLFENAKFLIQKLEWDSLLKSNDEIRIEAFNRLKEENKIELLDGNTELLKNVNLVFAGGHTEGFQYVVFNDNVGQEHIFAGDIIPTVWHLNNENHEDIDFDKVKLNNEKIKILEKCVNNHSKLYFQHSNSLKTSKVSKMNNRFKSIIS